MGACNACAEVREDVYAPRLEDLHAEHARLERENRLPLAPKRNDANGAGAQPKSGRMRPPPIPSTSPQIKSSEMPKVSVMNRIAMFEQQAAPERPIVSRGAARKPKGLQNVQKPPSSPEPEYDGWTGEMVKPKLNRSRSNGLDSPTPYPDRAPPSRDPSMIDPSVIKMAQESRTPRQSNAKAPPLPPRPSTPTIPRNIFSHDAMKSPNPSVRNVNTLALPDNIAVYNKSPPKPPQRALQRPVRAYPSTVPSPTLPKRPPAPAHDAPTLAPTRGPPPPPRSVRQRLASDDWEIEPD